MYKFIIYFLLFLFYSFVGWLMEVIVTFKNSKKFVNRGFLIGPCCSIYGSGAILLIILLKHYKHDTFALFTTAIFVCSTLEYLTSYVMEKLFKARWWDYSQLPFNVNGRICLKNSLIFGLFGVILLKYVNPFCYSVLNSIPSDITIIFFSILFSLYIIDNIVSFQIMFNIKNLVSKIHFDGTEEITKKVKEVLLSKSYFFIRVVKTFPNFKIVFKQKLAEIQNKKKKKHQKL